MDNKPDIRRIDKPDKDEPCCPWCTSLMALTVRKTHNGMMARYECPMCLSRAPAVCMDTAEECLVDAARLVAKSWLTGVANPTNGDKLRQLIAASNEKLAQLLLWLNDMGELDDRIHFCRNKPECEEIVEKGDCVPAEMCLQCLTHWIGQPADEKLWRNIYE